MTSDIVERVGWTREHLDSMHENIVASFPNGITPKQFRQVTLESADEDGRIYPHTLADWWAQQSLLMGMFFDGLICRRCRRHEAGPWYITEAGRAALKAIGATP